MCSRWRMPRENPSTRSRSRPVSPTISSSAPILAFCSRGGTPYSSEK